MLLAEILLPGNISDVSNSDFAEWLEAELNKRDWTRADLARRAGISKPQISRIMNREQSPGHSTCTGIAAALGLPPETVYRAAGLLAPVSERTDLTDKLLNVVDDLPPAEQNRLLAIAKRIYRNPRLMREFSI